MTKLFNPENIFMNLSVNSQEEAIEKAGQALVDDGAVTEKYISAMKDREQIVTTYMGNYLAIPHGTDDAKTEVLKSGLVLLHIPEGVDWDGNETKVVVGIAGKDGEHLDILSQIAIVFSEEENVDRVIKAESKDEILAIFEEVEL
nr:PTS sugar transporter subunit IIA [Mammaliicoccus sp. Marseille-Q6498]